MLKRLRQQQAESQADQQLQLLCFQVGQEWFGVDIANICEVSLPLAYTKVPEKSGLVEGFISLRQELIPIVDTSKKFFGIATQPTAATRIIIAFLDKGKHRFWVDAHKAGFITDAVTRVIKVSKKAILPPFKMMTKLDTDFLLGMVEWENHQVLVVDFNKLLAKSNKMEILKYLSEEEKQELVQQILKH